uniref:Uncharacterized protein n=1 Tax=Aegilops tauschii subsp. strangulata TaxID=200361 RepID=A0A452YAV2_AEGTS
MHDRSRRSNAPPHSHHNSTRGIDAAAASLLLHCRFPAGLEPDAAAGADPVRGLHRGPGQQQRPHHGGAVRLRALRPGLPRPQRHRQVQQRQDRRRHPRYGYIIRFKHAWHGMAGIETDGWHLILPAARMGLKQYVPAYLGTELSDSDLLTGVSFASGGCGFDP